MSNTYKSFIVRSTRCLLMFCCLTFGFNAGKAYAQETVLGNVIDTTGSVVGSIIGGIVGGIGGGGGSDDDSSTGGAIGGVLPTPEEMEEIDDAVIPPPSDGPVPAPDSQDLVVKNWTECTASDAPTNKNYCVHNYIETTGITGDTGDDMFRVDRDAQAFFEYKRIGDLADPDRLKWIERGKGPTKGLMMPSGPAATYEDYRNFIDNYPAAVVTVEGACYPTEFKVCKNIKFEPPPVDGACGDAHGQRYAHMDNIPEDAHCHIGKQKGKSQDAKLITWKCSGKNGGADSETCKAHRTEDAQCGAANGQTFANKSELESSELCAPGTASAVSGDGPWSWQCISDAPTGEHAGCYAFKEGEDCSTFAENDNMILVQDLSGSFGDDLPNIQNGFRALFNNPEFKDWHVGITSYTDHPTCSGCTTSDYPYRKELNFTRVGGGGKHTIVSTIESMSAYGGGDGPESQYYAMEQAMNDFESQRPAKTGGGPLGGGGKESYTLVLITDATSHGSPSSVSSRVNSDNHRVIVLGTGNVRTFYENGILLTAPGEFIEITSDSGNFADALTRGLTSVRCE